MSVPDPSNSKAPPSLLSGTEKAEYANGSRILASLEGRVESGPVRPRRSKSVYALPALLLAGAAAWGGWHYLLDWRTDSQSGSAAVSSIRAGAGANGNKSIIAAGASSQPTNTAANTSAATKPASGAATQAATPQAASISQVGSIVAGDDDNASLKTTGRIANALENGASEEIAAAAAPPNKVASTGNTTDAAGKKADPSAKPTIARSDAKTTRRSLRQDVRDSKTSWHETLAAQSKKHPSAQNAIKTDDQDVDLLAALVSRTKPYTPPATSKLDGDAPRMSVKGDAKLAAHLKECGKDNFFTDEICRWRACDGHWGKDPACPAASETNNSRN
jgi:hypothetical protein